MSGPVYLDYNATAPPRPSVRAAIDASLERFGNPSSVHRFGRAARAAVEDTREALAAAIGVSPGRVVFTSGGTEANALAMRGIAAAIGARTVLASAVEHPSVLAHVGVEDRLPVDADGLIVLAALDRLLAERPGPALIGVMAANNETGVVQPIADVVRIARKHGARVHCDAVQALGKRSLSFEAYGVDSMSVSAHKIGGLKGTGALVLTPELEPVAAMIGGGQERSRRAGTENTIGLAAFGAALREVPAMLGEGARIAALRDDLEARALRAIPEATVYGRGALRLPNTSCIAVAGLPSNTQLMALDLAGVAVSAGAACSSGKVTASHVLVAMGVPEATAGCALRVSLGWETTPAEADRFLEAWTALVEKHRPSLAEAGRS